MVIAGNETTRNSIAGGMEALIEHPDQHRRLRDDPLAPPDRGRGDPALGVAGALHAPHRDPRHRDPGVPIAEGDKVVMWYPAANRDAEVFAEPDSFDVGARPQSASRVRHRPALLPGRAARAPAAPRDVLGAARAAAASGAHRAGAAHPHQLPGGDQVDAGAVRLIDRCLSEGAGKLLPYSPGFGSQRSTTFQPRDLAPARKRSDATPVV